jgi:hypothetical protein
MKETPILFKPEMVRAVLSGTKKQTRRVVKPLTPPKGVLPLELKPWIIGGEQEVDDHGSPCWAGTHPDYPTGEKWFSCPYGKVGDRLWVREQMEVVSCTENHIVVKYCADGTISGNLPYPSRLKGTPIVGKKLAYGGYREASRLNLKIGDIRVERVADISAEDAIKEGIESKFSKILRCDAYRNYGFKPTKHVKEDWLKCPIASFRTLWNSINERRGYSWTSNPWVWVIEFENI